MTQITQHAPGTFCWPELSSTDQAAAEKFYPSVFGWEIKLSPMGPDAHYTIFLKDGKAVAALAQMMEDLRKKGVPSHWLSYVSTASAAETTARARQLGGTVIQDAFDVMDLGRMAVLQDPLGTAFAVWQAKSHPGAGVLEEPGSLCWTELVTTDTVKAGSFYTQLFGWTTADMPMPSGSYTLFKRGEKSAAGMMARTPEMGNVPAHWMPYFSVADCDKTVARATEKGGSTLVPPQEVPTVGRFALLQDPQGAAFAVIKLSA